MDSAVLSAELQINELCYFVSLGCSDAEKSILQEVLISVSVVFANPPQACESDDLQNTICYAQIADCLFVSFENQKFNTIEKLAMHSWQVVKKLCTEKTQISIKINKVRPPIGRKNSGSTFLLKGIT